MHQIIRMSSIKRRKITSLPLKVKRHIPGQKPQVVTHDLMTATFESFDFKEFDECETRRNNYLADRTGEAVSASGDEPEHDDVTEGSEHSTREDLNFTAWSNILKKSLKVSCEIEGHFMSSLVCCNCNTKVGEIRCLDCSIESTYCKDCARDIHKCWNFWAHSLEIRKNGTFVPWKENIPHISNHHHGKCSSARNREIVCVDWKGIQHKVNVKFCQCEEEFITLLRFGFWGATPQRPELAFHLHFIRSLMHLQLEAHVSVKGFCAAYSFLNKKNFLDTKYRSLYPAILRSFEHFKLYYYEMQQLTFLSDVLPDGSTCPACPKESGKMMVTLDGLFGLPRKRSAGEKRRERLLSNLFLLEQENVDNFVSCYVSDTKKEEGECSTFIAGDALRSANKFKALDETALFGYCCRHDFPGRFISLKHGERLAYGVWMLKMLTESTQMNDINLFVSYDITCVLKSHLEKSNQTELVENVNLSLPIFHAFGHKASCQVQLSPRRVQGIGLTDGEQLERLWSYLRRFARMTKEMRPENRTDTLCMALYHYGERITFQIGLSLQNKRQNAEVILEKTTDELTTLLETIGGNLEDVSRWAELERLVLVKKAARERNGDQPGDWQISYLDSLLTLTRLRIQLSELPIDACQHGKLDSKLKRLEKRILIIENENKIALRWNKNDPEYVRALPKYFEHKRKEVLLAARDKVYEKMFLQAQKSKYADGQAVAKRLSRRLDHVIKAISKLVRVYNSIDSPDSLLHTSQQHLPFSVQNEDVMNLSSHLWSAVDAIDYVVSTQHINPMQRKAIDLWNLKNRCEEEKSNVQNDMQCSISHCKSEISAINEVIRSLNINDSSTQYDIGAASWLTRNRMCSEFCLHFYQRSFGFDEEEFSQYDVESVTDVVDTYFFENDSDSDDSDSDDSDRDVLAYEQIN